MDKDKSVVLVDFLKTGRTDVCSQESEKDRKINVLKTHKTAKRSEKQKQRNTNTHRVKTWKSVEGSLKNDRCVGTAQRVAGLRPLLDVIFSLVPFFLLFLC